MADWTTAAGVEPATARDLTARMTRAAAGMVLEQEELSLEAILEELATPGGVTTLGLDVLQDRAALKAWRESCEAVLSRFRTKA